MSGIQARSSLNQLAVTNDVLNRQLERFWKQEDLPKNWNTPVKRNIVNNTFKILFEEKRMEDL